MIIVKTPLRISFAGGGSDIPQFYLTHGGATLSTAINKYVYVMVSKHFDDNRIRVSYSKTEIVPHRDALEHTRVKAGMEHLGLESGLEIVTMADIPSQGTGLGSSSSFTVGLLKALHAYRGQTVSEQQLAEEACHVEITMLGEPIGKQDQFIASYGGLRFIQYLPGGHVQVDYVVMPPAALERLEGSLLLFYTGIQRSANGILKKQVDGLTDAKKIENLKQMTEFARAMKKDLEQGKLDDFGRMLHEGWELKKTLAEGITNPEIEDMYKTARAHGALGGKLLGAGGGGFLLVYAPLEKHQAIKQALSNYREMKVRFDPEGSKILFINKNLA